MPKKFFDILPPGQRKFRSFNKSADNKKEKSSGNRKNKPLAIVFGILVLIGIFSYFNFREARIEIRPVSEILNFKKDITADAKMAEADPSLWVKEKTVPAKFIEETKEISRQFPSSGVKAIEKKAEGTIRVYNNYKERVNFRARTRFLTADGKLFRSKGKIYIPVGGFLDVKVEAAEPGPDYNIKPSTFSIPGLVGYASYTSVYGKSSAAMAGGFLGKVSYVKQDDLDKAEDILTEELKKESEKSLKKKVGTDYVLLEKAMSQEVINASSLAPAGAEVEKFNFQVKIKSKAIVFDKKDLRDFAMEFVGGQIKASQKIYEKSLKVSYFPQSISLEKGKVNLSLEFSGKVYSKIIVSELKKSLFGKSLSEAEIILKNRPEIAGAQVEFWPFWVKSVPQVPEKIKITLKLD